MSEKKPWSTGQIAGCDFLQTLIIPRQFDVRKDQWSYRKNAVQWSLMRPLHGNWPAFYLLIHCIIGSYFVYLSIKNSIIFLPWHTNPRIPMSM
ncbi:hypothetical protein CLI80_02980 [Porphyromonas gingivalis]|nr:hypothetical protein CLI80_02980 [Porphyromonas gingivalis]